MTDDKFTAGSRSAAGRWRTCKHAQAHTGPGISGFMGILLDLKISMSGPGVIEIGVIFP